MVATIAAGTTAQYYTALTDYYAGGGEPHGVWAKVGIPVDFRRGDRVDSAEFERLHAALDRKGKRLLVNDGGKIERVGGYDATFSAPKSVSALWGISEDALRVGIEQAQAAAVTHALDVLEANAAFCRFGKGGAVRAPARLTVATFTHGDARPAEHEDGDVFSDPNLHTHAVILNLAFEGRFRALDGKAFFAWKMAAGAAYHQALANGLQALGLAIEPAGRNGLFEVAGVDKRLRQYFSARRQGIEEELEALGASSAEAPALAAAITKSTRRTKLAPDADRFSLWRGKARALGFEPKTLASGCVRSERQRELGSEANEALDKGRREAEIAATLAGIPNALTENESAFELRALHAALSSALVGAGEPVERVDKEIESLVVAKAIVALDHDQWGHETFTTPEMLAIEREIIELSRSIAARSRIGASSGARPNQASVEAMLKGSRLSEEQQRAVRAATSGEAITIIEGAPGAGKTTTLSVIASAWRSAGYDVIGSATAWKIANALRDELGVEARATDSWLARSAAGLPFLTDKTVLIFDEVGLLSSRQMHKILKVFEAAYARGGSPRLIAVGDRDQLQAVGAGSGLRLLAAAVPVQGVKLIQRQNEAWIRDAILKFGHGEAEFALESFAERGHLHWQDGARETIRQLVGAWEKAASDEPGAGRLAIAQTNVEVRAINGEIRRRLRQAGAIAEKEIIIPASTPSGHSVTLPIARGDRLRFLTRAVLASQEVINGSEAVVDGIDAEPGEEPTIRATLGRRSVSFRPSDIADANGRARLAHAYATTVYGSQGLTVDRAFVLASPAMDRHAIYVASSRARLSTDLYVDSRALDARANIDRPLAERANNSNLDANERLAYLAKQLGRSGLKRTSLDVIADAEHLQLQAAARISRELPRTRQISLS